MIHFFVVTKKVIYHQKNNQEYFIIINLGVFTQSSTVIETHKPFQC